MLSNFASPNNTTTQIIFAGVLDPVHAADDKMWVAECNGQELWNLLEDPIAWVSALGDLKSWKDAGGDPEKPPVLLPNFTIKLDEYVPKNDRDPDALVQGISHTGILTVRPAKKLLPFFGLRMRGVGPAVSASMDLEHHVALAMSPKELKTHLDAKNLSVAEVATKYWEGMVQGHDGAKRVLITNIDEDNQRFYAHSQIYDPAVKNDHPRGQQIATYLTHACCDPVGYIGMMNKLDVQTYKMSEPYKPSAKMELKHQTTGAMGAGDPMVSFLYSSSGTSDDVVCDVGLGTYNPNTGKWDTTIIKDYAPSGG